ncbi:hypothetical protein N9Y12_04070 [Candidatus Pelagibacter bacterium]|nr:hypothetical protein [Candidatus Pelagibacter bacterium]MDB2710175.1 hypothetical protein [Candidatus Pelagibacter bacterium]
MIFYIKNKKLFLCPIDLLFISSIFYCVYGMLWLNEKILFFKEPLIILFSISFFWIYKKTLSNSKDQSYISLEITLNEKNFYMIHLIATVGIVSFLIFYFILGAEYFSLTKDLRYKYIKSTEVPRIISFVSMIGLFVGSVSNKQYYQKYRKFIVIIFWIISFLEINREMILLMSFVSYSRFLSNIKHTGKNIKLISLFFIMMGALLMIFSKPLLFYYQFGTYPDSIYNVSELTNWLRHFAYVKINNFDVSEVQKYDLQYLLNAIIFPYSFFNSASKIFYEDILQNTYYGMTYGYSGLLWTNYYFKNYFLIIPWILLCIIYSKTYFKNNDFLRIAFSLILAILVYRFFRSEWPLVIKTGLWVYFYPTLILYFLIRKTN